MAQPFPSTDWHVGQYYNKVYCIGEQHIEENLFLRTIPSNFNDFSFEDLTQNISIKTEFELPENWLGVFQWTTVSCSRDRLRKKQQMPSGRYISLQPNIIWQFELYAWMTRILDDWTEETLFSTLIQS